MAMSISDTGLDIIKRFEGCKLTSYKDSVGVWTIGYGHTSGVTSGQTITQAQADAFLRSDCGTAEKAVNAYYARYQWNQNQFDALVSFTFNCGAGNLKTLLQGGTRTIAQISAKIPAYNKAGGKVLAGLTRRRAAEKELFDRAAQGGGTAAGTTSTASSGVSAPAYTAGRTYTAQVEVNVRKGPGTNYAKAGYSGLTANARANDKDRDGAIDKGTKVTCKEIRKVGDDVWMRIPSGWIAAYYGGEAYVK